MDDDDDGTLLGREGTRKLLDDLLKPPSTPQPPAPDYHVPSKDYCSYGWVSLGPGDENHWLECNCEDPANPWPPRGPTDGPKECDCYYCMGKPRADRGRDPCESFNHHCDMCHELGHCTELACKEA